MLAQPKEAAAVSVGPAAGRRCRVPEPRAAAVDAVPLFASLTEEEKEALAATMTRRTYRKGEVLAEQGAKLTSLVIIRTASSSPASEEGEVELSRLSPGDYFGEGGLFTGAASREPFAP